MRLTRARIARRKIRRIGLRHRTIFAALGGILAVVPAAVFSGGTTNWTAPANPEHTHDAPLVGGFDPRLIVRLSVDGTLPRAVVESLPQYQLPDGPLGIPGTALKAYHSAADILAVERPDCRLDWALLASVGRIESNHARGGYVDANGTTLEPILGPELNGIGPVAAIPDTDGGRWDRDVLWDRAVGPTQFIPATWTLWGADGNGDGVADPDNLYDATLATARYLCSGGQDLANPDQLRAAIYRYNNSDVYVNTVILWADAYRKGVLRLPDSDVPIGAPTAPAVPVSPPVAPPAPAVTPPPAASATLGGAPANPSAPPTQPSQPSTPDGSGGPTTVPTTVSTAGPTTVPTTVPPTTPTCPPPSTTTTTTTTTPAPPATPDPCAPLSSTTTTPSATTT